jgi:anti-anti-sigma factor
MPVSTSLSASSLNESAGARTPLASLVTGVLVLLTLLVLAPVFSSLPKPVLAALIIDAVVFGMIDVAELRRLYRVKRVDFVIAAVAIVGVLSVGVLAGVVFGIALSLGWLVYVATTPPIPVIAAEDGLVVLRPDGGLFFATADALHDRLRQIARDSDPPLHAVVLDLEGVDFVDSQGSAKLVELAELADLNRITLSLVRVKETVLTVLEADGVVERIGADHVHDRIPEAISAAREAPVG